MACCNLKNGYEMLRLSLGLLTFHKCEICAVSGTMYRGKSSAGRMADFEREPFTDSFKAQTTFCVNSIHFNHGKKLSGKLKAALAVFVGLTRIELKDLGLLRSESGYFSWDDMETCFLPLSFPIYATDFVDLKITLLHTAGMSFISRTHNKVLHA